MAQFLVEAYQADAGGDRLAEIVARARAAAAEMRRDGIDVRYVRAVHLPDDETCFHFFEAPSADAVGEATRRASLRYERIVRAA